MFFQVEDCWRRNRKRYPSKSFALASSMLPKAYLPIPLQTPGGYSAGDASAADLDGDGEYEIIIHMTGRGSDNSQA